MSVISAIWDAFYQTFGVRAIWAILVLPALVVGFTLHEYAHAWMAVRLGDPTPKLDGRLTLNPLKHLDPLGTLLVFIAFIGWAKPVRWNPLYLRVPRRVGVILVAAAGPVSNLLLALAALLVVKFFPFVLDLSLGGMLSMANLIGVFITFNVILFVFNLIPLPPLDGFSVLVGLAPRAWEPLILFLHRYGTLLLLALIFFGSGIIGALVNTVMGVLTAVVL